MKNKYFIILIISIFICACVNDKYYLENGKYSKNDSIDFLNMAEGDSLNKIAKIKKEKCDFRLKNVAFFTGEVGSVRVNKYYYFNMWEQFRKIRLEAYPASTFYLFDAEEREKTGYYAAIVFGSVKQEPTKKRIIRRLRKR